MIRLLTFLFFVFLLSSPLFGGGGKKQSSGKAALSAYFQIDPASPQQVGYVKTLEAFLAANPDIEMDIEYATGEGFHQKFQSMAAAGDVPDTFTTYVGKRTAYVTDTGKALDLREYITDDYKSKFIDAAWEAQGPNGEIYTVPPSMAVCHVVYANTNIMKELGLSYPQTYEELLAQAEAIRAAGYYPVSMGNKDQWVVNSWLLSAFVDRLGGKAWLDSARTGGASFTEAPLVESLKIVKEMVDQNIFSPGVNQMSNTEADQEFYQQKSVYLIDAGWRTSAMVNELPQEQQDAITMQPFPALPGEINANSSAAVPQEGFGISAKLKGKPEADAAWRWVSFYAGEEGAAIRLEHGEVPTFKLDLSSYDLPGLQVKYAEYSNTYPMGYVIDAKMDPAGMGVLNPDIQAMMLGRMAPEEVAERYEAWVAENETGRGN